MLSSPSFAPTSESCGAVAGTDAQVTVFLNRQWFEYGIGKMLRAASGQHAVLYVAVRGLEPDSPAASRKAVSLVGNTLRAGMRAGAVAYLGAARFAVLLLHTDAWQTAAYARVAVDVVGGCRVSQGGELLPIQACIGGVMAGHSCDGEYLLGLAEAAIDVAWGKPGSKVHLLHGPQ